MYFEIIFDNSIIQSKISYNKFLLWMHFLVKLEALENRDHDWDADSAVNWRMAMDTILMMLELKYIIPEISISVKTQKNNNIQQSKLNILPVVSRKGIFA